MRREYLPPSVSPSESPYVGIVKSYDFQKGFGYIMILYKRDLFFHISNSKIKNLKVNTFVAFKVRRNSIKNRVEAYDIDTIYNYQDLLLSNKENLLASDEKLVYFANPQLLDERIKESLKEEYKLLQNIDSYIDNYDIDKAIDSYSITINKGHRYKPGDDDAAWVNYFGIRLSGLYLIKKEYTKIITDPYIDIILPEYYEEIFYDRGFSPWQKMMDEFGDLSSYEEEAKRKTKIIREAAKMMYRKSIHKQIVEDYLSRIIHKETEEFKNKIIRELEDTLQYGYKLKCNLSEMII